MTAVSLILKWVPVIDVVLKFRIRVLALSDYCLYYLTLTLTLILTLNLGFSSLSYVRYKRLYICVLYTISI